MNDTKYKSNIQYSFLKALGCGGALLFTAACSNYNRYGADDRDPSELSNESKGNNISNKRIKIGRRDELLKKAIKNYQKNCQALLSSTIVKHYWKRREKTQ